MRSAESRDPGSEIVSRCAKPYAHLVSAEIRIIGRRVRNGPMEALHAPRKHRADFVRAEGDDRSAEPASTSSTDLE